MRRPGTLRGLLAVTATAALLTGGAAHSAAAANLPIPCAPLVAPPFCTAGPTPPPLAPVVKGPPTPTPAKPTPTPTPSPSPKPSGLASGALGVTGVIDDPALSTKVTEVLQHPVAAERPSLHHFRADTGTAAPASRRPKPAAASRPGVLGLIVLLVVVLGLVGALLGIRRASRRALRLPSLPGGGLRRSLPRPALPRLSLPRLSLPRLSLPRLSLPRLSLRLTVPRLTVPRLSRSGMVSRRPTAPGAPLIRSNAGRMAVVGLLVPVTALVAGLVLPAATRSVVAPARRAHAPARPPVATTPMDPGIVSSRLTQTAQTVGWNRLVDIEQSLERQRDDLAAQESRVARLNGQLQKETPNTPRAAQLLAQLQQLITAHQAATAAYDQLLQTEYEFFQGAVQSPPVRHDLVAVAAASVHPDAAPAVRYDLDLVEAQRNQEAALSAAEAQAQASPPDPVTALLRSVGRPTLISPMGGTIEQGFGPTSLSIEPPVSHNGRFFEHFHTGIDISAPMDTPVHAAAAGRVILAAASVGDGGQLVGYGRYVAISHGNGFTTVYGHLDAINVRVGQIVHQGDVIGREGSTGNSTGPHLHFETRVNGAAVDPAPYLKGVLHLR